MKPEIDSIGIVFFGKTPKWYIIGENGKAIYITESQWFDCVDEGKKINQPLYCED